jgi:hypothetical protein
VLLGLHDERKPGLIAQKVMIEFRNAGSRGPIPEMEVTRHQALRDERFNQTETVDHFERCRMGCGGSWTVIHLRFRFENRHRESMLGACERRHHANRTCADNNDAWRFHLMTDLAEIVQNAIFDDADFPEIR